MQKIVLRPDQITAFESIQPHGKGIVNMPTGWGKSVLLATLAAADHVKCRKAVITVPQKLIGRNFAKRVQYTLPDGNVMNWNPHNLCDFTPQKVKQLVEYLVDDDPNPVLTTHATLAYANEQLDDATFAACIRDTTFIIDESHHVQANEDSSNKLGNFVVRLLNANEPTAKIYMATAYFFRGDKNAIIPEEELIQFHRYHVPFDEYWRSLKHLKTYQYDFIIYRGMPFREIDQLFARSTEPTIIYCPPENHKALGGLTKDEYVAKLIDMASKRMDAELWAPGAETNGRYIVDLVDANHRNEKIQYLSDHGKNVCAVTAVGMLKEGADWQQAARVIDLVPSGSDQDRLQRFGRLCRDHENKKHVTYHNFFPFVAEESQDERRLTLSRLYAHFHACLVLENAIKPLRPMVKPTSDPKEPSEPKAPRSNPLASYGMDEQEEIVRQSVDAVIRLCSDNQERTTKEVETAIVAALFAMDRVRDGDHQPLAFQVMRLMERRANVGVDAGDLIQTGFDKVFPIESLDEFIRFSADIGGPETLAEIRSIIDSVFDTAWNENYTAVAKLAEPPQKTHPRYWWVHAQRAAQHQGKMTPERKAKLDSIPWWGSHMTFAERWQQRFDEISQLPIKPTPGTTEYGWVRQQWIMRDRLTPERIALVESIPWWEWPVPVNKFDHWHSVFASLTNKPKAGDGVCPMYRHYIKQYRKGNLSPEQVAKLESIPWWSWGDTAANKWEANYTTLAALETPPENSYHPMYQWMCIQQRRYKKSTVPPEQVAKLESISWWRWDKPPVQRNKRGFPKGTHKFPNRKKTINQK